MRDIDKIREEFPVTKKWIYFNHASVAPISRRVSRAMRRLLMDVETNGAVHSQRWNEMYRRARRSAAQLLNCMRGEIAFVKNTTEGILIVANGIRWERGDNAVIASKEFPANVYPWLNLRHRGVETRFVEEREGRISVEEIQAAMDERTRIVSLSSIEFASGFRNDLDRIGRICQERQVLFMVDAIQSLGAMKLDVHGSRIDFASADAHKWLCGAEGSGIFYCSRKAMKKIDVVNLGWAGVLNPGDYLNYDMTLQRDARRFETGTFNTVGIYGLKAAIDLLLEVGIEEIEARVLALTDRLCGSLNERGYTVFSSRAPNERSGIVSFFSERHESQRLFELLLENNIIAAVRDGKVRVSPHFYNTEEEIDRLLKVLPG